MEAIVNSPPKKRSVGAIVPAALMLVIAALAIGALEWHKHAINAPVQAALVGETGATTVTYRRDLIGGNDIVFDVTSTTGDISEVDMTRRLLKAAEALKNEDFDKVYLAYKGREKFYFDGSYFKTLGEERESQNPVYTVRTMPESVHNLDGSSAFQTWAGGLLGVVGQQFDDLNEFHRKWWVNDALAGAPH